MTLEIFRAVTPFITLLLMIGVWMIGWLVKRLIAESSQHFSDLKKELKHKIDQRSWELEKRMDKLERDLEKLEASRLADQKYLYEQFVSKEGFYRTVGKTESSIGRIFKLINQLNRTVHQSIHTRSPTQD
jgi:C4-dicarboxylate-specific signal transduction histidine kinase